MLNKIREPFDTNCTTPHLASLLLWAIDADRRKRKERGKSDITVNHHETVICPEYVGTSEAPVTEEVFSQSDRAIVSNVGAFSSAAVELQSREFSGGRGTQECKQQ